MSIVNKPKVSKPLARFYGTVAAFILVLGVLLASLPELRTHSEQAIDATIVLAAVFGFVELVMLWILASIYGTRYILTENELILKASRLIGGKKRIPLKTIKSMNRTLIPFGFRIFGASFYGGYYYFPSVGRAFMVITNFRDGILIKAEHENYVFTPRDPESFIEAIEKMKSRGLTSV